MAKKIDRTIPKQTKPKVVKRRNQKSDKNEPTENEPELEPTTPDRISSQENSDVDEDEESFDESDITEGTDQSIFRHGKSFGEKPGKGGAFNDFTDGVMFNPSEPPMGFDSEWVRFLNQLSADETTKSLSDYIRIAPLTRRAKYKLMIYIRTLLDREFTMSNILDGNDMNSVNLDKLLIDADLTLGLTRFDLSPEFQHIINLVRIKFGIKVRRSLFGFERINVNTQRSVQEMNEGGTHQTEVKRNIRDRIKDLFKGD